MSLSSFKFCGNHRGLLVTATIVAAVLLMAGGLKALQTASIAAALPVSVIMLVMTYGLVKSLHEDPSAVAAPDEEFAPDGTRLGADLRT